MWNSCFFAQYWIQSLSDRSITILSNDESCFLVSCNPIRTRHPGVVQRCDIYANPCSQSPLHWLAYQRSRLEGFVIEAYQSFLGPPSLPLSRALNSALRYRPTDEVMPLLDYFLSASAKTLYFTVDTSKSSCTGLPAKTSMVKTWS
jgi:hypothetical protein